MAFREGGEPGRRAETRTLALQARSCIRAAGASTLVVIAAEKLGRDRAFAIPLVVIAPTDLGNGIRLVEPAAQIDDAAALAAEGGRDDGVQIDGGAADGATGHGWSPRWPGLLVTAGNSRAAWKRADAA